MKNRNWLVGTLAALCLVGGRAFGSETSDSMITTKIKAELAGHKSVSAINTHVETNDGVVTLTGTARSSAEKELAERYARDVQGVKDVDNQIAVRDERTGESAGAAPADDRGAGSRMLDRVGDGAITSRVKSALEADRATSSLRPTVETKNGEVVLYGTADSEAQKDMAERLAKGVSGVKSVDNQLDVASPDEK